MEPAAALPTKGRYDQAIARSSLQRTRSRQAASQSMKLPTLPLHARSLTLLLALLVPFASNAGAGAAKVKSVVDATIRPLMSRHDIPGMAVSLTVDGRSYVFNYGVSSRQSQTPVSDSTIFEIGSISKMFTTTLAAYAHATGRMSLDDHPGRFLPRLRGRPIRKLPRQVDSPEVETSWLNTLGLNTAGGTLPRESCGRWWL